MTVKISRAALISSAVLFASPVFAQSNAEIIADEMIALSTAQGAEVTIGSRAQSGDTLRLEDVTYSFTQDGGTAEVNIDWLAFKEVGQSVEMTFAPVINGTVVPPEGQGTIKLQVENDGLVYALSGTPDAREYDIRGQSMFVNVTMVDGPAELKDLNMTFGMNGLSGNALLAGGVTGTVETVLKAASASLIYVVDAEGMKANIISDMTDLAMSFAGDQVTAETAASLFTGERGFNLGMTIGLNTFEGSFVPENGVEMNLSGQAASAIADISLGNGGLNYDVTAKDLAYNVATAALPMPPIDVTMSEYGMRFAMPIGAAGTTGDIALRMTLRDLLVSESVWAMIDPASVLPRDAATLNIDISGKATTKVDFGDPQSMAALQAPPIDLEDIAINDITLQVAGAELLASGAATLNNSGPIPVPTGKINASMRGVNGLIEKLMQLGLVQPQQAMPARMMMGMFAVPGDGPDHLTSEIEFKSDGGILANGIPLR